MANIPPNVQGLQQLLSRLEGAEANWDATAATQQNMQQLMHLVQNLHTIQGQLGSLQQVVHNVPTMDVNALLSSIEGTQTR